MSETYFVTGAAGGIGLEVARALLDRGARVIVAARDESRCAHARAQLGEQVETVAIDFASFASIRAGAAHVRAIAPRLDALINNAAVVETTRKLDVDGHEIMWGVNVLAPFLLTELMLPALEESPRPRVVNVGSVAHKQGKLDLNDPEYAARKFGAWSAYAQSKLALLLLTREFAKRYPAIAFNCVHPGGIATDIWRNAPALLRAILARVLPAASTGAIPIVRVAAEPALAGVTGRYFDKNVEAVPSAAARDDATAARLFDLLAGVTGVSAAKAAR